jgi:hypothetical protein
VGDGPSLSAWQDVKLDDGKIVIPGVVDSLTNLVEHPRPIAQRSSNTRRSLAERMSSREQTLVSGHLLVPLLYIPRRSSESSGRWQRGAS